MFPSVSSLYSDLSLSQFNSPSQGPEQTHEQVPQPLRSENPRAQIARVILSMHKQAPFAQYTVPFLVHRTGSVVGDRYVYTHPA